MIDMTYDPEADAAFIYLGRGEVDRTEEAGPFVYDLDRGEKIIGIEILSCKEVLSPGDWANAPLPGTRLMNAAE